MMKKKKEAAPKLDKKQRPTQGGQALKFLGSTVIKLTRSKDEDKEAVKEVRFRILKNRTRLNNEE